MKEANFDKEERQSLENNAKMIGKWIRENICPNMMRGVKVTLDCKLKQYRGSEYMIVHPDGYIEVAIGPFAPVLDDETHWSAEECEYLMNVWSYYKKKLLEWVKEQHERRNRIMNFQP